MAFFVMAKAGHLKSATIKAGGMKSEHHISFQEHGQFNLAAPGSGFHGGGQINFNPSGHNESGTLGYQGPHGGIEVTITHGCNTGGGCQTGGGINGHINY